MQRTFTILVILLILLTQANAQLSASPQKLKDARVFYLNVLKTIKKDIKENYFDPNLRGYDIDAAATTAAALINEAKSDSEMDDIIARVLYPLNDSHVYYIPPSKTTTIEYGWEMTFIGDKAFVTKIEDESDAYKKGLRVGDQIYMVNDFILSRSEFSLFQYHYFVLRPQYVLNVLLIKPSGNKYKLELKSKIKQESVFLPSRRELTIQAENEYNETNKQFFNDEIPGLAIWKMPSFELSSRQLKKMLEKVGKSKALILDLRSNSGGYFESMLELAGYFFEKTLTCCTIQERKKLKTIKLKPSGKNFYKGNVVILTDSDSASASEAFSRLMQIEKRATVIGDQSAGALMVSVTFYHTFGSNVLIPYGTSITIGEMFMKDNQSLEKIGVMPDEKILPTALDLANRRDPVLARAAEILGFKINSEQASSIFANKNK